MSILMGVTLSFFMSLLGTLISGHFTFVSWLISFGISLAISLFIGFVVPMPRIEAAACRKAKLHPGTLPATLLSALISDTIYTPLMTVVMVLIMVGTATAGIDKGIAGVDGETAGVQSQITSLQSELASLGGSDPEKADGLQAQIGSLQGRLAELDGQKAGMEAAKPPMGKSILISLLVCYPAGYVVIVLVQPLYLKMLLKKLGPPHGTHGGQRSPAGAPPEGMPPRGE